jgi:bifunctional non-homologous end joining protein LigD
MKKSSLPTISPMLAKSGKMPADHTAFGFEIKWDGIRAVCYCSEGTLRILSRNLKDLTFQYPELAGLAKAAPANMILDGEIITIAEDGKPSFSRLQHRMGLRSSRTIEKMMLSTPATYVIFDILYLDGKLLLDLPYTERRRILAELALSGPSWQTPPYRPSEGPAMLAGSKTLGLEGVIAKRLDSHYQSGERTGAWIKIKNQFRQELVIGGWVEGEGRRRGKIGAVLVGYYDIPPDQAAKQKIKQRLVYAGKVGTGFSDRALTELSQQFKPLMQSSSPFSQPPPVKAAHYLKPELIAEFEFTEWTPHNTLRHPAYKGLRQDKEPRYVIRE